MTVRRFADEEIVAALGRAEASLDAGPINAALQPPAGPFALFNHLVHAKERVGDVLLIFRRLVAGRHQLTELNTEVQRIMPRDWPPNVPFPALVSSLMGRAGETTHALKVDLESLFHFGSVLLDQWSHVVGYLVGVPNPERHVFHEFVQSLDRAALPFALIPIRDKLKAEARWLHFWMRTYRNGFVVHASRPWQRGTTARVIGDEFNLFTPSPPGWENDEEVDAAILAELALAPEWLQRKEPEYWERARPGRLLERIVENVGSLDRQADRDRIAALARRKGLSTPTFQVLATVLADFVGLGTSLVMDAALRDADKINLGPSRASEVLEG